MIKLFYFWFFVLIVKLFASALIPLASDETYYWVWSKHLQLSYFDHPAMISWLIRLGHPFEWIGHAVRWPAVLIGHLTSAVWILILKDHLSQKQLYWWFGVFCCAPLVGFGSIFLTPDIPLLFFWSLSLYFCIKLLKQPSLSNYAFLGFSLGLGFCSKYHIVLFVPSLILWLTFERLWSHVKFKFLPLTFLFGLIASLPVLIWNAQNNWSSFQFQLAHGLGGGNWKYSWTTNYVLAQFLIGFPIFWFYVFQFKTPKHFRYLLYFTWFPFIFFFLSSFKGIVEANWANVAYPTLVVLAILSIKNRIWIWSHNLFWITLLIALLIQMRHPFLPIEPEKLKTNELQQFSSTLSLIDQYQPFYAYSYQMASYLWYYRKEPVYKLYKSSRHDFFDEFPEAKPEAPLFYVSKAKNHNLPDWILKGPYKVKDIKDIDNQFKLVAIEKK